MTRFSGFNLSFWLGFILFGLLSACGTGGANLELNELQGQWASSWGRINGDSSDLLVFDFNFKDKVLESQLFEALNLGSSEQPFELQGSEIVLSNSPKKLRLRLDNFSPQRCTLRFEAYQGDQGGEFEIYLDKK